MGCVAHNNKEKGRCKNAAVAIDKLDTLEHKCLPNPK